MKNIHSSGNDGFVYHGGNWSTYYDEVSYDGLKSAEVGFQNFGTVDFKLNRFLLKDIGPFYYYTVFSSNGRGRPTYTHPQQKVWVTNGEYRNCQA